MSGLRKDELVPVFIDFHGEKQKMVEDIADTVLRRVLEEEENDKVPVPVESRVSSTSSLPSSSSTATSSSPLSINQLLSSSFSQQTPLVPVPLVLNPFQLALCQSLVANNTLQFPIFGGPSPIFPLFVPPPQPAVESTELLKILQNILAKQRK
ncbi:hypothetical protein CAEBREN_05994 [Caenorhabditis brenneri]|uniref:Uncharacterized protein n=1 Tax=Caenorhabditis brenneri TaxID=135651 RepID=G0PER4_CAEBE|nr:hypothetical protein CAEBREN_05994 [Caenorhabditis brenneri]